MKRIVLLLLVMMFTIDAMAQLELIVGESRSLTAPTAPRGTIDACSWSTDADYVSVSGNKSRGTVKIYRYFTGVAEIECYYNYSYYDRNKGYYIVDHGTQYYYVSCKPSTLTLNKTQLHLRPGENYTLKYIPESDNLDLMPVWTTSDKSIVGLGDSGNQETLEYLYKEVNIRAKDIGTCIIRCDGFTGRPAPTCEVIVSADPPQRIVVSPESVQLQEGNKTSFKYTMMPEDSYAKITWSSSDESIAIVDKYGNVKAVAPGEAKVIATTDNGLSAYGVIKVIPLPQTVSLVAEENIRAGYTRKLVPELAPSDALATYSWNSSDTKIVSVDSEGNIRGKNPGVATITVSTQNNKIATCRVSVVAPSEGMDSRNVRIRISALKSLFNDVVK
jgi:uncharacterized protein YjdB